jgi:hypothetical protein
MVWRGRLFAEDAKLPRNGGSFRPARRPAMTDLYFENDDRLARLRLVSAIHEARVALAAGDEERTGEAIDVVDALAVEALAEDLLLDAPEKPRA